MNIKPQFHGSDLEKIAEYYNLSQESIVNFGANVNPLGLSKLARQSLIDHMDIISRYPDREYKSLKRVIANYCSVPIDTIMVGNGSSQLISLLIEQIHPTKTLVLGPTYSEYARELSFSNSESTYYHLNAENDFQLNVQDFIHELKQGYDLLILCNPNNPTSTAVHLQELRQIIDVCNTQNTYVMIDETYVEFCEDPKDVSAVSLVEEFKNFIVLRGVSKFFAAPGIRMGYGITSNRALREQMLYHQTPWSLNSVAAFLGEMMLQDQPYIEETRALISSEKKRITEALQAMPGIKVYPSDANFLLIKLLCDNPTEGLGKCYKASHVFETCIQQGLMVRDCSSFQCLNGEYIRFCLLSPDDNDRLLDVLSELFT